METANPFDADRDGKYSGWHGRVIDLDQGPTVEIEWSDDLQLAEVEAEYETGARWDGTLCAIVRLTDGRWMTWETFYGPTGDGFNEDAYGGDADVFVSSDRARAIEFGLSDEARRNLGLPHNATSSREAE
jgi:hypothetical protein